MTAATRAGVTCGSQPIRKTVSNDVTNEGIYKSISTNYVNALNDLGHTVVVIFDGDDKCDETEDEDADEHTDDEDDADNCSPFISNDMCSRCL